MNELFRDNVDQRSSQSCECRDSQLVNVQRISICGVLGHKRDIHIILSPQGWGIIEKGEKDGKSQRLGGAYWKVSSGMVGPPLSWTHPSCSGLHRACGGSSQSAFDLISPTSKGGARESWQLPEEEQSIFFKDSAPDGLTKLRDGPTPWSVWKAQIRVGRLF